MIYHLVEKKLWNTSNKSYAPESLVQEGFIHFSTLDQVDGTYQRFYKDKEMLLLHVDESKLKAELKYEPADGSLYPHLYGPLNCDAIVEVKEYIHT